jgi:micrococcal nuclease
MPHILAALAIGFFSFLPCLAYADLTGQVIHVADGDTLTLVINKEWVRARLAGIDAPEANQPFGKLSRESLSDLCFWQQVTVIPKGKDQYGRMFAQVLCGDVDAGAEQVRRGMAWVYDHDVKDNDLNPLQADAKAAKRGLWADPYSKPPWKWREVWQE